MTIAAAMGLQGTFTPDTAAPAVIQFVRQLSAGVGIPANLAQLNKVDPADSVSYTHLDVYKRQHLRRSGSRERAFQHDLCGHLRFRCCRYRWCFRHVHAGNDPQGLLLSLIHILAKSLCCGLVRHENTKNKRRLFRYEGRSDLYLSLIHI